MFGKWKTTNQIFYHFNDSYSKLSTFVLYCIISFHGFLIVNYEL